MATRIEEILLRVRDTLADPSGARWPTERLVRLVDEAQKDICRQAKILRKRIYINLQPGIAEYALPDDAIRLERILYEGKPVSVNTHEDLDTTILNWEAEIGPKVKAIVFDKLNLKSIRVYPIPTIADSDVPVVPLTGMVVSLAGFYMQNILGVLTDLELSQTEITQSEVPTENYLMVQYSRKSNTITKVSDTLEISSVYDDALKYYITGRALKDDMDAQNRAAGNEELQFYDKALKGAKVDNSYDTTQVNRTTKYNGAF